MSRAVRDVGTKSAFKDEKRGRRKSRMGTCVTKEEWALVQPLLDFGSRESSVGVALWAVACTSWSVRRAK